VSKATLADALFRIGALRFGKFTLVSGKTSSYYLDLRIIPSYPEVYAIVVEAYEDVAWRLGKSGFDVVAGVATAGVTVSSPLAFLLKKPMVYVRREEKGHGLGRLVEGAVLPGWKALVVDDLATTGGSIASAVEALRKEGCRVMDAVVLVDRLEGAEENLRAIGVKLSPVAQIKELIDSLHEAGKVTKCDYNAVLRQMGVRKK
jgi:orotate phosphoribosyltransferase